VLKNDESLGYSLTGITSGLVLKRARNSVKTYGLFTRDWPEWILMETAFHLDLDWVCLKESTFVAKLSFLYPTVTFISWEIGVNLPPVNFVFCSQLILPLTHDVWKCKMLEVLFAAVHQLRFIKVLDWVAVPINQKIRCWGVLSHGADVYEMAKFTLKRAEKMISRSRLSKTKLVFLANQQISFLIFWESYQEPPPFQGCVTPTALGILAWFPIAA
jgi:hypothetical protein